MKASYLSVFVSLRPHQQRNSQLAPLREIQADDMPGPHYDISYDLMT